MHVCHMYKTSCFESGGVVRYIYDQGRGIAKRGHLVDLCTCDSPELATQAREVWGESIGIYSLSKSSLLDIAIRAKPSPHIVKLLDSASVIHFHGLWSPFALNVAQHAVSHEIPYVITLHGMLDDWCMSQGGLKKRFYLRVFARKFLANASTVITSTTEERLQALQWLPDAPIQVLPPVMDLSLFESAPNKEMAHKK